MKNRLYVVVCVFVLLQVLFTGCQKQSTSQKSDSSKKDTIYLVENSKPDSDEKLENVGYGENIETEEVEIFGNTYTVPTSWYIKDNGDESKNIYFKFFETEQPDLDVLGDGSIVIMSINGVLKGGKHYSDSEKYLSLAKDALEDMFYKDATIDISERYDKTETAGYHFVGKNESTNNVIESYFFMNNFTDAIAIAYYRNPVAGVDKSSDVKAFVDSMNFSFSGFLPDDDDKTSVGKNDSNSSGNTFVSHSFTNKYGTATTKCAHAGCNNYIASSGDTNCCTEHSNKCLNCGKYIDEDAMYCMECLEGATVNKSTSSENGNSYKKGSEWEGYDKDKDGNINDDEWQDALGDYLNNME